MRAANGQGIASDKQLDSCPHNLPEDPTHRSG